MERRVRNSRLIVQAMNRVAPNRRRLTAMVLIVLIVSVAHWATPAWSVTLVRDGQTQCTIVVPREEQAIVDAARDLQYHLRKMSGAEVPLVHHPSEVDPRHGVGIYIDTKPLNAHVPGRLIDRSKVWPDGYVIELLDVDGRNGVFLSSPVASGVQNAVYGLLEDYLGCRWFTIGPMGEHIPRRATVKLDIPGGREIARPAFERRTPWYNGNPIAEMSREGVALMNQFYRRNRRGEPFGMTGHAWERIFAPEVLDDLDEDGDGVSDLFVEFKGRRRRDIGGLCMSHPKAVEIATEHFMRLFDANRHFDYASFIQFDSATWCCCERCKAMASNHGARMLVMSNRIAENVARAHPDKRILISLYKETREPPEPSIRAHPNLFGIICPLVNVDHIRPKTADIPLNSNFRRQIKGWMKILPAAWSRDYIGGPNGPWTLFHSMQQTMDFYRSVGCTGVMSEYLSRNMGTDVLMWLTFRTAWDSSLRVADLLEEFYPTYFGAAAGDMRWVYERLERHMLTLDGAGAILDAPRIYPPELVDACLARVAAARGKVAGDETILARIERDENCLNATRLWVRFCLALAKVTIEDRREATRACQEYLEFARGLDGTLTLGGRLREIAERMHEALTGSGTYFAESWDGQPWPGPFRYYDNLDQGGKTFDARSRTGFRSGPYGLYLEPGATGEIVYDMRLASGLVFKDVHLPAGPGGVDLAISLALTERGHNGIEVSLDEGRTWITAFKDVRPLGSRGDVVRYDLTKHVRGSNRFLLKFWTQNAGDTEILAMDSWTITGTAEHAGRLPGDGVSTGK